MPRHRGGDKRSSWLTFQRRLFLVRRLIRSAADSATLIAEARAAFDAEIYPPDATAALRHDVDALRREFGCTIRFKASTGYVLEEPGQLALLDLPDPELEALVFLVTTFADSRLPNAVQIEALLHRIISLLPDGRRPPLLHSFTYPRFDYPLTTTEPPRKMLSLLKRAVRHQQVVFDYHSTHTTNGCTERHRVAPHDLFYKDGHTYLDGYCHECSTGELAGQHIFYRLDRIVAGSLTRCVGRP